MEKILFNHDAAIDEFMAVVLLTTMRDKHFCGSVIMNAEADDTPGKLSTLVRPAGV